MAVTTPLPFLLLLLLLPALARRTPPTTATLDIAGILTQTTQVLTSTTTSTPQNLSSLTFHLHSRDSLTSNPPPDYKTLTLARLRRDADRVNALTTRLSLALESVSHADLVPQDESKTLTLTSAMEGPVVSGTRQGSGEYFSRVNIGTPAKSMYMVLDTGSDVTWIQCQPCADCYTQADAVFHPRTSSTYKSLPCDSSQCRTLDVSACRNSTCLYQVSYGDGSYTVGDFGMDTVSFGSGGSVPEVAFGCGHDNEGLFVGAAGLLGLGGGELSFPSQLKASSFSYCLVDRDSSSSSTLEFGRKGAEFAAGAATANAVSAPLIKNSKMDTFYYVGLTGMSVGGRSVDIPSSAFAMDSSGNGGVIVDSGTAVTRLNADAYAVVRDAFRSGTRDLPRAESVALFDTCYDLAGRSTVEVPTVSFVFDDEDLKLPAKNYLIPVDSSGTFCFAFAPASATSGLSIIGNVQQQGTRVTFDIGKARVGFESGQC